MRWLPLLVCFVSSAPSFAQDKKSDLFQPLPPIKVVPYTATTPVDYEKQVVPILENKCLTCHSGSIKKGRYDMSSLEGLLKGGKSGSAIVSGKPEESLLVKLAGRTGTPPMPPKDDDPLAPEELAVMKAWIAQGAKGPAGAIVKQASTVKLTKLAERLKPIFALAISPDKKTLAAGRGATIHLYGTGKEESDRPLLNLALKDDQGKPLGQSQLDLIEALLFSKDGKLLISSGYREVNVWDVASGAIVKRLTGFADRVVALDLSPDGRFLATAGGAPTQDGEVKIIDLNTGEPVLTLKTPHSDTVFGVRFSPNGSMLATASADKFVKVWAVKTILPTELPSTAIASVARLVTLNGNPASLLGRQTASLARLQTTEWKLQSPGDLLKSFEGHTHHVLDVAWRADGKVLVSAGADNVMKVWDFERGEQVRSIAGHAKQISRLAMLTSSAQAISACGDAGLRQWNIDNGGNVRNFGGATDFLQAVAATPDGTLVAGGGQEGIVRLYNGQSAALLKTFPLPEKKK
jgi:WD40 repeat protein